MATLLELARLDEDEARKMMEGMRWPNGPECPHCTSKNAVRLQGKATRPGVLKCRDCAKQFTVTVNSIMHQSRIPLSKWLIAFHLILFSKKGINVLQLQRNLRLGSYQTGRQMEQRIRYAMIVCGLAAPRYRDPEFDGKYLRGKPHRGSRKQAGLGRSARIQPAMTLDERDAKAWGRVFPTVSGGALRQVIHEAVDRDAPTSRVDCGCDGRIGRNQTGACQEFTCRAG
ncbi:MAG: IS1595 family transposase [Candidatus Tectomicrobia bacterium]|nr:IS1595 family transposase [Candidatus Tectomicrobia bacterium]